MGKKGKQYTPYKVLPERMLEIHAAIDSNLNPLEMYVPTGLIWEEVSIYPSRQRLLQSSCMLSEIMGLPKSGKSSIRKALEQSRIPLFEFPDEFHMAATTTLPSYQELKDSWSKEDPIDKVEFLMRLFEISKNMKMVHAHLALERKRETEAKILTGHFDAVPVHQMIYRGFNDVLGFDRYITQPDEWDLNVEEEKAIEANALAHSAKYVDFVVLVKLSFMEFERRKERRGKDTDGLVVNALTWQQYQLGYKWWLQNILPALLLRGVGFLLVDGAQPLERNIDIVRNYVEEVLFRHTSLNRIREKLQKERA